MSTSDLNIENTNIKTAAGVELSSQQRTLVGSVLDLFAGRPSLEKLQLWSDEAVFEDPITIARGRKQFEPQWVRQLKALVVVVVVAAADTRSTVSKAPSPRSRGCGTK